ncbi:hypothetical protein [Spirosoma rhododendri]|uniref:Uncharacterized protein n=1 Tax=Spirosoma rhododendri TaxID=2728024 RepID=A0A7L5DUB6_9BACT|nr:hypothetical protein [Spirosoma rhododendri]QJD79557.1 hypothetical protein HH216_14900 [Spirosoma rhododendri]
MGVPLIKDRTLPRQPGKEYEEVPLVTDGSMNLNFRNGETYSQAPTNACDFHGYIDKNIHYMLNGGVITPAGMAYMRTMFMKDANIQDINPGKPFNQFTKDECYAVAEFLWANKGPFGIVSGEAQESGSDWRFQTDYAPQQCKWVLEGLSKLKEKYAQFINLGASYAGPTTFWPTKSNLAAVSDACSDFNKLKQFLTSYEWGFAKYVSMDMHLTGALPQVNLYMVLNNGWDQYWKSRLGLLMMGQFLKGVNLDPRDQGGFGWWRCAAGIDPFTEQYQIDLGNGLVANTADFNIQNPQLQFATAAMAMQTIRHVLGWDNPYVFGIDRNKIARPDNTGRYSLSGSTNGRTLIDNGRFKPAPPQSGVDYAFPNVYYGPNDLGALAAKMRCLSTDFVNAWPGPVKWRPAGTSTWKTLDHTYYPSSCYNKEPDVNMATDGVNTAGGKRVVTIYGAGRGGTIEIDLGGSNNVATITYPGEVYKQYEITLT